MDDAIATEEGNLTFFCAREGVVPHVERAILATNVVEAFAIRRPERGATFGVMLDEEGEAARLGVITPNA